MSGSRFGPWAPWVVAAWGGVLGVAAGLCLIEIGRADLRTAPGWRFALGVVLPLAGALIALGVRGAGQRVRVVRARRREALLPAVSPVAGGELGGQSAGARVDPGRASDTMGP